MTRGKLLNLSFLIHKVEIVKNTVLQKLCQTSFRLTPSTSVCICQEAWHHSTNSTNRISTAACAVSFLNLASKSARSETKPHSTVCLNLQSHAATGRSYRPGHFHRRLQGRTEPSRVGGWRSAMPFPRLEADSDLGARAEAATHGPHTEEHRGPGFPPAPQQERGGSVGRGRLPANDHHLAGRWGRHGATSSWPGSRTTSAESCGRQSSQAPRAAPETRAGRGVTRAHWLAPELGAGQRAGIGSGRAGGRARRLGPHWVRGRRSLHPDTQAQTRSIGA